MDKLSWFKFCPTDWVMGKIQRCPEVTQARFMRLICLYWNKECVLSYEDAEIEIDKYHLDLLISKKIIKIEESFLIIDFLNEQLENISETSKKRREAVLQRWSKVKQKDTKESLEDTNNIQVYTSVLQIDTDKSRVDKIRKEEIIKENINTDLPFSFYNSLIDLGANKQFASEWLKVRKTKKLTNTETALNSFIKQVKKSGHTLNDVLEKCIEKSWGGFEYGWFTKDRIDNTNGIGRTNQKLMTYDD